jgi:hypothetical protein
MVFTKNNMLTAGLAATLTLLSLLNNVNCGGGMPAKWWKNTHAKEITSMTELNDLLQGDAKNKHVFIDFYMQ